MNTYHCSLSAISTGKSSGRGAPGWLIKKLRERAERLHVTQPYNTIGEFQEKCGLMRGNRWKLLPSRRVGHIAGLPSTWGIMTAVSGTLCAIEQDCGRIIIGHRANFIEHDPETLEAI